MVVKLFNPALYVLGVKHPREIIPISVEESKGYVPPKPSFRKRLRTRSDYSSGLSEKFPAKSAKVESTSSEPLSAEISKEGSVIPAQKEVISLLSDSPKPKPMVKVSAKHHAAVPSSQDLISLKIGKDSSIYSGYQSVHEECSKFLLPHDRKTIQSVRSGSLDHFHSQEAMRVISF